MNNKKVLMLVNISRMKIINFNVLGHSDSSLVYMYTALYNCGLINHIAVPQEYINNFKPPFNHVKISTTYVAKEDLAPIIGEINEILIKGSVDLHKIKLQKLMINYNNGEFINDANLQNILNQINTEIIDLEATEETFRQNKTMEIMMATGKLFSSYYEKFIEILNVQFSQFIKDRKHNYDPYQVNFLFRKTVKIQRQRLNNELNTKFNEITNSILNDKACEDINLNEDIDMFYFSYFNDQMNKLNKSMERVLVDARAYLDRMQVNLNKTNYKTHFLSDTELEARIVYEKRQKYKKNPNKYFSESESESESELNNSIEIKKSPSDEAVNLDVLKSLTYNEPENCSIIKQEIITPEKTPPKSNLNLGMRVFALKDELYYQWQTARIIQIKESSSNISNIRVRVKFEKNIEKTINLSKVPADYVDDEEDDCVIKELPTSYIALSEPIGESYILPIRSRIVSLNRNENDRKSPFYSVGSICEVPNPCNLNRYLIFFDDGYAQYVQKNEAFPVVDRFKIPIELNESHMQFLNKYFERYPEKEVLSLTKDFNLKVYYNSAWLDAKIVDVDCSLFRIFFNITNHYEWIFRGSYRLHPLYEKFMQSEMMKYRDSLLNDKNVKNLRILSNRSINDSTIPNSSIESTNQPYRYISAFASTIFPSTKKRIADKTTVSSSSISISKSANSTIDIVQPSLRNNKNTTKELEQVQQGQLTQIDLKGIIREESIPFESHSCTATCVSRWEKNISKEKPCNLLLVPIFCGWQRLIYSLAKESCSKIRKNAYYVAPCGRNLRSIDEIDRYLYLTNSNLTIDMFSTDVYIHIDREFEANARYLSIADIADGRDIVPIPCVNCIDSSKPEAFKYSNVRIPLEGVPLNTDFKLLDGCDCEDGCRDPLKCACWRKTYEASTFTSELNSNVGYRGRRLEEMVSTGIFECNAKCKCDKRCSNRVVQNGISVRLQLFKASAKKGWGLRCLDDIAKGAFICIYTGHVMTEEQSDVRGKDLGDEYFAELDFVECLKRLREETNKASDGDDSEDDIEVVIRKKKQMKTINTGENSIVSSLKVIASSSSNKEENAIELSNINFRNTALETIYSNRFFRNPKNRFYFKYFLDQTDIYIMDAKLCGNIGRYFNHSCSPNVFVQNVFIDTYDLRFPWVAFFASKYIRAGTELCWDYNYQPNSVKGRELYCQCGSTSCRGRLL